MDYFSKNDPDANGKHDTFGLTGYINKADLGSLAWVEWVFNENASRYEQRGDEIVDLALQEGTREALLWLNKAYAEGLIDPEVAVNTAAKAEQMLTEDKAGIVAMTLANAATIDQGNELGAYTPLSSLQAEANSALVTATSPANQGMYFISRFAKNHELNASLEVLNTLYSLAGNSEADPAARVLAVEVVGSTTVQFNNVDEQIKARYSQIEAERSEVSAKVLLEIELYAKLDSSLLALKTKLDRQMTEMKVKVIVGAISIEDWDSYVTKLSKDSDYIAIMDAFNNK